MSPSSLNGHDTLQAVMSPNPVTVDPQTTLDQALALLWRYRFRHLPVAVCNEVVGILSDRDLLLATAQLPSARRLRDRHGQKLPGAELVSEIMRAPVHCLPPDASPKQAALDMVKLMIGAIPVVAAGSLVGIVTETDLLRLFLEQCRSSRGRCDDLARYHMHQPLTCIGRETTIEDALDALDPRIGHAGVVREGTLVGIVSERDLRAGLARSMLQDARAESEGRMDPAVLEAQEVMTERTVTAGSDALLSSCAGRMLDNRISALPMLEDGQPIGILTQRDVIEYFAAISPGP